MSLATVVFIDAIRSHPDPEVTRLEVIRVAGAVEGPTELVTGKHYRVGQRGIWIRPNAWIPGWLARELWLVGKRRESEMFEVRSINIKGVQSPGLFCGEIYQKDGSLASEQRYEQMAEGGAYEMGAGWISWPYWKESWRVGDDVTRELGIRDTTWTYSSWRDPGDESDR